MFKNMKIDMRLAGAFGIMVASEELAATSEEMSGQAQQLQQTMAVFTAPADHAGKPNGHDRGAAAADKHFVRF